MGFDTIQTLYSEILGRFSCCLVFSVFDAIEVDAKTRKGDLLLNTHS